MSMFSQLQEMKLSANENHSKPPALGNKIPPQSASSQSMVGNQSMPSNKGRRMSMFSQLQELKTSANLSLPTPLETKNSIPNEKTKTSGIFSGLQQLVASRRKTNKSEELGESAQRSNFFSKFFHTKVTPVSSPRIGRKLDKITALCRSVETVNEEVQMNNMPCARETNEHVNDMPNSHENNTVEHVIDIPNTHDHVSDTSNAHGNMTNVHVNGMPNVCVIRSNNEWCRPTGSRTSLFAGLRDVNTKRYAMKIIEDDEEEEEEQEMLATQKAHRRKSSSRKRSTTCAIDAGGNKDMGNDIAMQNITSDSNSISKESEQLTTVDT